MNRAKATLIYALALFLFVVSQVVIMDAVSDAGTAAAQPSANDERARTRALEGIHDELRRIRRLMETRSRQERNGG